MGGMDIYLEPHSGEWFKALEAINPQQASHTRQILDSAGRQDVCSICGEDPASIYRSVTEEQPINAVVTIRLCQDCRVIRKMQGESFVPINE
jgi:hypothetical protein